MNKYLKHLEVPENPLRAFKYPSRWLKTVIIILMMMMVIDDDKHINIWKQVNYR